MQPTHTSGTAPARLFAHTAHGDPDADQQELMLTAQMQRRLKRLADSANGVTETVAACLVLQNERDSVLGCFLLRRDSDAGLVVAHQAMKDTTVDLESVGKWLFSRVEQSLQTDSPIVASAPQAGFECIAVPIQVLDLCAIVTIVRAPLTAKQRSFELAISQMLSTFLDGTANRERLALVTSQMQTTASALELVMRTQKASTIQSACTQLVADLKSHWNCDQVFIGLSGELASGRKTCRLVAASDVAVIDTNAETSMTMKAVLDECIGRDDWGSWPPLPGTQPHQLLAHKSLARRDSLIISTPLKTIDGRTVGALAMIGRREMAAIPNLRQFVSAISEPLGETLHCVARNQRGPIRRAVAAATSDKHRLKLSAAAFVLVAFAVILCLPWPYTITCGSLIEPVERRFCVAPHDGLLETTLAEPGELVRGGQLLAKMDGREILWELAGVSADKNRASKKRDTHMAKHETPEAMMADLECQSLENQESLLQFKESHLEMASPIDGVVLSGSLDRRDNYPVSKGQVLYEIAPLEKLRVEVAIPAEDVLHVQPGDSIRVFFDGFGTQSVAGVIDRIRPRSEVRDAENVFVAEVTIENTARQLRPGMEGVAKIKTGSRSIGWIIFHRAIEHTRAALPW